MKFGSDILFKDEKCRECYVENTLCKLFDAIVGRCKKCENGFIKIEKKITSIKDLANFSYSQNCSCRNTFEKYKQYVISGIPQEFWDMKDLELQIDIESRTKLNMYIEKLDKVYERGFGILFLGSPEGLMKHNSGTGKTASGMKILEHAIGNKRTAHYITMHSYFNLVYRSKNREDSDFYESLIDEIEGVDFLCIDEIGKVIKTDYVYKRFEDMMRRRSSQMLVNLMTTNMNEGELEEFVGPSLMDILRHNMMRVELTGNSFRKKRFLDIKKHLQLEV